MMLCDMLLVCSATGCHTAFKVLAVRAFDFTSRFGTDRTPALIANPLGWRRQQAFFRHLGGVPDHSVVKVVGLFCLFTAVILALVLALAAAAAH